MLHIWIRVFDIEQLHFIYNNLINNSNYDSPPSPAFTAFSYLNPGILSQLVHLSSNNLSWEMSWIIFTFWWQYGLVNRALHHKREISYLSFFSFLFWSSVDTSSSSVWSLDTESSFNSVPEGESTEYNHIQRWNNV